MFVFSLYLLSHSFENVILQTHVIVDKIISMLSSVKVG